jgi:glycosyltransferase involved in cell wall biosynthesis
MDGWRHRRAVISPTRSPLGTLAALPGRAPRLARAARAPDLVHVHGDTAALLALPAVRRRPAVVTTHGLHLLRRGRGVGGRLAAAAIGRSLARCRAVICTSEAERDELAALYGPPLADRLAVVRNGIDLPAPPAPATRAAVRAELGLEPDAVTALYLGQLEPRKDPLTAVAAAEAAAARATRLRLVVAGDGPLLGEVTRAAGGACRVVGFRDDPDRLLAASDVFVLPSEREGASFALLEAMGRGLAVVVSDGAGNPEVAGEAGLTFPVGDAGALAEVLARLAADPPERERLGEAARRRVERELSRARMVAGVRRVYERALTGPGRGDGGSPA